jgi:hypothetical protein
MNKSRLILWILLAAIVAIVAEAVRWKITALPNVVSAHIFERVEYANSALGPSDIRFSADESDLTGRRVGDVTLPSTFNGVKDHEPLTVSVWRRRYFVIASQELLIVARQDGSVVFSGGSARHLFPILVTPE